MREPVDEVNLTPSYLRFHISSGLAIHFPEPSTVSASLVGVTRVPPFARRSWPQGPLGIFSPVTKLIREVRPSGGQRHSSLPGGARIVEMNHTRASLKSFFIRRRTVVVPRAYNNPPDDSVFPSYWLCLPGQIFITLSADVHPGRREQMTAVTSFYTFCALLIELDEIHLCSTRG